MSATRYKDYEALMTSAFIPANQRSASIDVLIVNDFLVEGNQQFIIFLNAVSNNIGIDSSNSNIIVNIIDDDIVDGE